MELETALESALVFEKRIGDLYIEVVAGTDAAADAPDHLCNPFSDTENRSFCGSRTS